MLCDTAGCGPSRESGHACTCDMDRWHDVWTLTDAGGLVQLGDGGGRALDEGGVESALGGRWRRRRRRRGGRVAGMMAGRNKNGLCGEAK